MPLLWLVVTILTHPRAVADIHPSAFRLDLLLRTLGYNGLAAVIATVTALPTALVLGRGRGPVARVLWLLTPAALFMPSLAFAYGWAQALRLAGVSFPAGSAGDVLRCVWTLAAWLWAVPACVIGLALRRMDTAVQQQALLDGAPLRVTIRQLAGPIVASLAAVTILATQEFAVYEPTGISVVATEVRMVFDTGAFSSLANPITAVGVTSGGAAAPDQRGRAASAVATAVPLLFMTLALAAVAARAAVRVTAADAITIGDWPRSLDAPRWATVLAVLLLVLNVGVPVAALVFALKVKLSLVRMWEEFALPAGGSIAVAAVAASVGLIAALSAAARWTRGLLLLAALSFLIGGQLLAIAMIRITNRPSLYWAYNSLALPAAAYAGRFGWIPLAAALSTFSTRWKDLRDIAAVDGATPGRVARSIVYPLAWPTLLAGAVLLGALSLTEVPTTVLLSPQHPQVLTPMLMTWVHMARYDPMIEASLLMVLMVLLPTLAALLLLPLTRRAFRLSRTSPSASGGNNFPRRPRIPPSSSASPPRPTA